MQRRPIESSLVFGNLQNSKFSPASHCNVTGLALQNYFAVQTRDTHCGSAGVHFRGSVPLNSVQCRLPTCSAIQFETGPAPPAAGELLRPKS